MGFPGYPSSLNSGRRFGGTRSALEAPDPRSQQPRREMAMAEKDPADGRISANVWAALIGVLLILLGLAPYLLSR